MSRWEYWKYIRTIKTYLKLDGYKTKLLKHSQPTHHCSKCGSTNPAEKVAIVFPFTERVLIFYVCRCVTCNIAYLYRNIEVIKDETETEQS